MRFGGLPADSTRHALTSCAQRRRAAGCSLLSPQGTKSRSPRTCWGRGYHSRVAVPAQGLKRRPRRDRILGGMYAHRSRSTISSAPSPVRRVAAYAQTKRLQVIMAQLLAEDADSAALPSARCTRAGGTPAVRTSLPRSAGDAGPVANSGQGADTVIWLASSTARAARRRVLVRPAPRSRTCCPDARIGCRARALKAFCDLQVAQRPRRKRAA